MLWREEFGEQGEHVCFGGFVDLAEAFDQPVFVHCPNLIQRNLSRLALESHRNASGVGAAFCGHGGDDDGLDVMVHFVWRDDKAGTGFTDFTTVGGVEADEKDVEAGDYHVQSFRSHREDDGTTVSIS